MNRDDETASLPAVQAVPATLPVPQHVAPAAPVATAVPVAPAVHRFGDVWTYFAERLLAFGIDTFVLAFVLATFVFNALDFGNIANAERFANAASFATLALVSFSGAFALAVVCEGLFGSTLGKLLFSLGVGRSRGGRAGFGRALLRRVLVPVDAVLVGPLLALVTPRHQRLGDLAAGTVVAHSPIGALAPIIALVAFAGIGYAQIAFGGGFGSVVGVSAAATAYLPELAGRVTGSVRPQARLPVAPSSAVPASTP